MSRSIRRKALAGLASVAIVVATFASPADAAPDSSTEKPAAEPVKVIADGLNSTGGISYGPKGLFVTEGTKGQVTQIDPKTGDKWPVVTGLNSPAGVSAVDNKLAIVTGGVEVPDADISGSASVFVARPGGQPKLLADLLAYEKEHNVDGQLQYDPATNEPLDALSNPFAVLYGVGKTYVFVADAGANAVYAISRRGEVRPFFLPPLVTDGACAGQPNNDPEHAGCDPVPTGLAYGPNGDLYVSTLGSLVPGAGRVYVLNPYTGKVKRVIDGLTAPTSVAVDDRGNVYTSEATFGAPEGEGPPPEGFDPSTVGRIIRIDKNGVVTEAQVTMPLGLNIHGGHLYAGTWSLAELFLQLTDKGQIIKVSPKAFK